MPTPGRSDLVLFHLENQETQTAAGERSGSLHFEVERDYGASGAKVMHSRRAPLVFANVTPSWCAASQMGAAPLDLLQFGLSSIGAWLIAAGAASGGARSCHALSRRVSRDVFARDGDSSRRRKPPPKAKDRSTVKYLGGQDNSGRRTKRITLPKAGCGRAARGTGQRPASPTGGRWPGSMNR